MRKILLFNTLRQTNAVHKVARSNKETEKKKWLKTETLKNLHTIENTYRPTFSQYIIGNMGVDMTFLFYLT